MKDSEKLLVNPFKICLQFYLVNKFQKSFDYFIHYYEMNKNTIIQHILFKIENSEIISRIYVFYQFYK